MSDPIRDIRTVLINHGDPIVRQTYDYIVDLELVSAKQRDDHAAEVERLTDHLRSRGEHIEYLRADAEKLEAEVERLQRQREGFDCQYAGQYAEMSGSHCPIGDPCYRCRMERAEAEVERLTKKAEERERVWTEHVARREAEVDDDKRATVRWAEREVERLREALRGLLAGRAKDDPYVKAALDGLLTSLEGEPAPQGSVEDITQAIAGRNK